jgi:hypothetical protein
MTDTKPQTTQAEEWYSLKLGEYFAPDNNTIIRRVPGGWVHTNLHGNCFIPWDNEFQPRRDGDVE